MKTNAEKKIFVLLPDGVGLRTFAYTRLPELAKSASCNLVFWNNTPMDLSQLGLDEIAFSGSRVHAFTDSYKNARKHIELNSFSRRFNDRVYQTYKFGMKAKGFKSAVRIAFTKYLISRFDSGTGLIKIRDKIKQLERKTHAYKMATAVLKSHKPDLDNFRG